MGTDPTKLTGVHSPLVDIQREGSALIVKPAGPSIGQRESPIITADVQPYLAKDAPKSKFFVFDLTNVQFMSSMGLGMCIALRNSAVATGAKVVLYGANGELRKLLAMMKVDKLYTFADTPSQLRDLVKG